MKLAVDFSTFAKRYVREMGSDRLDDIIQHASELALCVILLPELISGLKRRFRKGAFIINPARRSTGSHHISYQP